MNDEEKNKNFPQIRIHSLAKEHVEKIIALLKRSDPGASVSAYTSELLLSQPLPENKSETGASA